MEQKLLININRLGGQIRDINIALSAIKNPEEENRDYRWDENQIVELIDWLRMPKELISRDTLERYNKMSSTQFVPFTLAEPEIIVERIISPLESAKRSSCTGDFIASIALSGLVGEMLTVLVWEINLEARLIKNQKLNHLNKDFERINQAQRIDIIEACEYITRENGEDFRKLKRLRNDLLHKWTVKYTREELEKISIGCFNLAASLVHKIIRIDFADNGTLKLDTKILNYINKNKTEMGQKVD